MAVTGFAGNAEGGVKLHYDRAHKAAVKRCGSKRAAGRNVYKEHSTLANGDRVGARQYRKLTARLNGLCRPLLTRTVQIRSSTTPRSGGGLPDCTWRPESGGSYTVTNPSSGAYGRYQVIPSTWAAHCSDLDRGPAGQDECAARVYRAQGAGAWVNC
jgi:hypothetical protein